MPNDIPELKWVSSPSRSFLQASKETSGGPERPLKCARREFRFTPVGGDLDVQRHLDVEEVLVLSQVLRHLALQAPQFSVQMADGVLQESFWVKFTEAA